MKVVLSFDSFKGGMSATEACAAAQRALTEAVPRVAVESIPLADGGEGTAEILAAALGGSWVAVKTMGPLPDAQVDSGFVWIPDRKLAIVEMARSSGLPLVEPERRNPMLTTTYGTGQLLHAAAAQGAQEIWLTVGGSATVDGGVGAAMALGWRVLDSEGRLVPLGGAALERMVRFEPPSSWSFPPCTVLCDVTNPLLGTRGAARTFGPQKGATPEMIEKLERGLRNLVMIAKRDFGVDVSELPGAGAAGGLAAGAVIFFRARLTSGIKTVMSALRYKERVRDADWIITGEGRFDRQSLDGKVVSGVLEAAKAARVRVAVLAGSVKLGEPEWRAVGIQYVAALAPENMPLEEAVRRERNNLVRAVKAFCESCLRA